jgi:hypothetical protein
MPTPPAARPSRSAPLCRLAGVALLAAAACKQPDKPSGTGPGTAGADTSGDTSAVRIADADAEKASRVVEALDKIPKGAPAGCDAAPEQSKHWEVQSAALLDSANGQLVARATATLTGYGYLRKASNAAFTRRDVPIGYLTLDRAYRGVAAGTYCMSAAFVGEAGQLGEPARWSIRLYRRGDLRGEPLPQRMRFEWRQPEEPGNDDPRVPVRFVVERPGGRAAGAARGSGFLAAALGPRLLARLRVQDELRAPSAWFRCGAGCCSGSTYFE